MGTPVTADPATPTVVMAVTAMATAATAGQATPTMDTEVTTSVMLMLSQATEVTVMEATPESATAMDMVMGVTAMGTPVTADPATPTVVMAATTSAMPMLSQATEGMVMEATLSPGSATVMDMDMAMGVTA